MHFILCFSVKELLVRTHTIFHCKNNPVKTRTCVDFVPFLKLLIMLKNSPNEFSDYCITYHNSHFFYPCEKDIRFTLTKFYTARKKATYNIPIKFCLSWIRRRNVTKFFRIYSDITINVRNYVKFKPNCLRHH